MRKKKCNASFDLHANLHIAHATIFKQRSLCPDTYKQKTSELVHSNLYTAQTPILPQQLLHVTCMF